MIRSNSLLTGLFVLLCVTLPMAPLVKAGEEERAPPPTRQSDVLSEQVFRAISEIQELLSPEDPNEEPDFERAKEELDQLYERRYERMNDFEKSTTLNFYTNYYLNTDNIPEALRIFEQMLTIENLRPDVRLRTLRALGQLNMAEENYELAIQFYTQWREVSEEEDDTVFLGLANSHFSIGNYAEAVPFMLSHMEMLAEQGDTIERNKWGLLNVLYIEQEDYENALEVSKNMIVYFNDPADWRNLSAIYSFLDQDSNRIGSLGVRHLMGMMEEDTEYLNLGQSLAGQDVSYLGAKIVVEGIERGLVEEDEDNLNTLVQMYQLAAEYEMAIEPATRVAEMSDSGDGYDQLGYLYYMIRDYQASADAFQAAIDKGNLTNASDTNLFYARALVELDRYEDAEAAARRAADLGDNNEQSAANGYLSFIEGQARRYNAIQQRREAVEEFMETYPSLL